MNDLGQAPQAAAAQPDEWRYRAFISYAHKDEAAARALHRALESYRVPSRLVGQDTCLGPAPRRLGRFFRDRDELSAAGQLSDVLRSALVDSQFLIVIVSQAAAASKWVNEEVRQFRLLGRDAQVLAFIPAHAEGTIEEMFPRTLRYLVNADGTLSDTPAEPVAADARKRGDGARLARLKLVAGLTCLPLDDIVRREAARRQRRLGIAAIAASILAIAMTFLAVAAIRGQAEAERQRAEADGLIEFMLTDLRAKLEPVGRLEVLDSVGQRALAYYAGQRLDRLSADELGRRSRALLLVGEVRDLRGDSDGALAAFREAERTTAELLARDPGNPDRMYDHAQTVFHIGNIAWQRKDMATVEAKFRAYDDLASRMVASDPESPKWLQEQSYAHTNLGVLYRDTGQLEKAVERFGMAVALDEKLLEGAQDATDGEERYALAQSLAWWSDGLRDTGRFAAALDARQREIALHDDMLAADPRHAQALQGKGNALGAAATCLLLEGRDLEAAVDRSGAGLALLQALLAEEPDNQLLREITVAAALTHAEAHLLAGGYGAAAAANAFALAEATRLAEGSRSARHHNLLLEARGRQILVLRAQGRVAEAEGLTGDFLRDSGGSSGGAFDRALLYLIAALEKRALGDAAGAAEQANQARLVLGPNARNRNAAVLAVLDREFPRAGQPRAQSTNGYPVERLLSVGGQRVER